ncbi:MAG: macro domain-containing protein [Lachnospiraceae bacterium]|nr:macro domain-containing protein [Lachnospiraceae bacterium]
MKTLFATPSEQESEALEETKPEAEFIDTVTEVVDTITEEVVSVTEPAGYAEETAEDIGTEAAESEPEEAEEVSEETYETAPEETSESGYGETLGESTEDNAEPAAEEPAETAYEYEEEPAAAAAAESAEESAETAEEPAEEYASAEEPEEASEEPDEESGEDTEEPDEEDEEEDESEEDEESDEESGEEEEQEDEDDYADRRQEEPARPVTQFIPHTEPAPQRPLTYRDEIRSEIVIKHGNIAAVNCDCVVNATNTTLLGGPGLDNSILKAAGPELLRECAALKGCDVGRAKISGGYRLKAQFVIHTVGPRYSGDETDPVYLTMCYENCLNLAMKYDIRSIAFPAISTGYYGYPLREATLVASRTVRGWMRRHPEYGIKVIFVSADDRTFAMYKDVFKG